MRRPKILTTMREYSWPLFRADVVAGLTVAMVALPLSLAIAIASGADPAKGLVTAIVGGFFISLLGGSRVQIGGPTGAFIVVVFGVIAEHGYDGLVLATLMAGAMLLAAGYFRLGRLITFIPEAVVHGFTIGIAFIIAISQLADFFGLTVADMPAEFFGKFDALWTARDTISISALAVAMITLVLLFAFRRFAPRLPGSIIAVAIGSALIVWTGLSADTVASRFGALSAGLPTPALPVITFERLQALLPSAMIIAFLAGVESLLSAMVADRMIGSRHRSNAELIAQGSANIASSVLGGMPVTGAIARTATNVRAGGQTPVAGIVHALAILVVLLLAAPLAGAMAMPALAALLMLTAWNMSEPWKWRSYFALRGRDRFLLVVTLVLTVTIDLTVAIGTGVSLGMLLQLRDRKVEAEQWSEPER